MKSRNAHVAIVRKVGRRKSRTKVGLRAVVFFLVLTLFIAAIAIGVNIQVEDRMQRQTIQHGT